MLKQTTTLKIAGKEQSDFHVIFCHEHLRALIIRYVYEGVNILTTTDFYHSLFSTYVIILFENL